MAIPPFTDESLLPPGIHQATRGELLDRFGGPSAQREAIAESLMWALDSARRAGIARFVVDGSFVDAKAEPNDADCMLLFAADYPRDLVAAREIEEGFPYVQLIVFEQVEDFEAFLSLQFGTDRAGRPRGVVEIEL